MELLPYVQALRHELAVAAEAGGPEARELADRLTAPLESALRLTLLDALSAAAAEITLDLAPGSVDLRLRGREPTFVVTPPPPSDRRDEAAATAVESPQRLGADGDDGVLARINVRLPEELKSRVEEAARHGGLSVNAWLVRAAAAALDPRDDARHSERRAPRGADRLTGWVR
ncbi:MAG: toxin-antitoxin system HicB family antitoxin [Mycobacteriales bacterium]